MKIYITLFLFIISFPFVRGGNDRIPVSIKGYSIETRYLNSDISALVLDFEDARLDDAFGMLPVYIKRIKLPSNDLAITATMIKEYSSLYSQSGIQDVADISYIGSEFKLVTNIVYEWGGNRAGKTFICRKLSSFSRLLVPYSHRQERDL
jgi:hypothetical protein